MAPADLPDDVMANLLGTPGADEAILTRWSHCALTDSPAATLGRGLAGDLPVPEVHARTVLRMGDAQSADYLVVDRLGEGGMGIVFEAEQVYFGRRVALKMIKPALASDPMAVKAFFREAVITSRLDHPGIIPVLDFGVSQDGRALYAMMKASGVPWHRVMHDKTLSENLAIFDRVADVVGYAHSHGILHRDIKPANVLLGNHGEVWLGDWGVALAKQPDGTYSHAGPAGTPQYMAPEMAQCDGTCIGPASDIYLLGAVLFEIITGNPPHDGDNARAALISSAQNTIHPTNQKNGLLQIAYKAMAARPEQRFASVDELRDAVTKRLRLNESVYRQQQADTHLSAARKTGDYDLFQQAVAGYDEAIALSNDNIAATKNRDRAILEYAEKALANGEFDLASSIIEPHAKNNKKIMELATAIAAGKEKRAAHGRRYKRQRLLLGVAAILILLGIVLFYVRTTETQRAVEAGKKIERIENDTRRRAAIMNLNGHLPPYGIHFGATFLDIDQNDALIFRTFDESDAEKEARERAELRREEARKLLSVQWENRDRVMDELAELLNPIRVACEDINNTKNDGDVTRVYQQLQRLKPELQREIEEISEMKKKGSLVESQADNMITNLTYLMSCPERYGNKPDLGYSP